MPVSGVTRGREYAQLLSSGGVTLDGITSTTNTTVSSEAIKVPEGYVGIFVLDVDTFTTGDVTAKVKVAFDGGTEWNTFWHDRAATTAATATLDAAGAKMIRILNPFPDIAVDDGTVGDVVFRVDLEADGADSNMAYGKCFYAVAPRVQGALLEGVPA
jgi:hypothetical protein